MAEPERFSDIPSLHTESTIPDEEYCRMYPPPKSRREGFIQEITSQPAEQQAASLAAALYDFRYYTKVDISLLRNEVTSRLDSLENLLRGFVAEIRVR